MNQVVFLSGVLCSGKSTYCETTMELQDHIRIGVSDIVRKVSGQNTRKELQDTASLDMQIANEIISILQANPTNKYIIDGIRQPSIYHAIISYLKRSKIRWDNVWLNVSLEECESRFNAKSDRKENISFKEAYDRDVKLGLLQLYHYWLTFGLELTIVNN